MNKKYFMHDSITSYERVPKRPPILRVRFLIALAIIAWWSTSGKSEPKVQHVVTKMERV